MRIVLRQWVCHNLFSIFPRVSNERSPLGPNPPQRKASVILPPEILDKILEYIPARSKGGGRSTLIACALVATWWTGPSQRHLFSLVTIDDKNHQRWINGVALSETKAHLLQYIRSFLHCLTPDDGTWYQMINLSRDSGGYLSALHNLHTLSLNKINFEHTGEKAFHACFSAFRETLTELSLGLIITSFNTFVTLVKYFPNITSLQLGSTSLRPDNGPVPPLSRPLRGMISILCPKPSFQEFVNKLAKLDMQYERLVIESSIRASGDVLKSILQLSASTIKYLRLVVPAQGNSPFWSCTPSLNTSRPRSGGCGRQSLSTAPRVGTFAKLVRFSL